MNIKIIKSLLLVYLGLFLVTSPGFAFHENAKSGTAESQLQDPTFIGWMIALRKEAMVKGISNATLDAALKGVKPLPRVIQLDRNQPEFKLSFEEYKDRVITRARINKGRKELRRNAKLLGEIEKTYGVQPRVIVALWAMETDFGRLTGGFRVIDALVTLAYDGRRSHYFRAELLNALQILEQGHISADKMKGSWAGAVGQTQFMPSTFLKHAVDFDGDGRKDVWGSRADALASGANYLAKTGWKGTQTWGREVSVSAKLDDSLFDLEVKKSLDAWGKLGVKQLNGKPLRHSKLQASLVKVEGPSQRTFLVYDNYRAIMDWNKSHNFAISVGLLSDAIGKLN